MQAIRKDYYLYNCTSLYFGGVHIIYMLVFYFIFQKIE